MKSTDIHTYKDILEVHNYHSKVNAFYDILAPIQVTLEYCRGVCPDDFYSFLLVSPSGSWFQTASIDTVFDKFNTRSQHQHNFFELLIVLEGKIIQKIEGKDYLYQAGSCCLINRNIVHIEKFIEETKVIFIGLSVEFVQELLNSKQTDAYLNNTSMLENPIFKFMKENLNSETTKSYVDFFPMWNNHSRISVLHKLADSLLSTLLLPKLGSAYMTKGLICELFHYLSTDFHITQIKLNASADVLLFSRISHMLEDTDGRMNRTDLEKALNYSGNYLNSIVQKHTGMCLFDYSITFRMKKTELLLRTTKLSVSEIAIRLEFSNRTHFYKLFKSKYGMSPKEYRQKCIP